MLPDIGLARIKQWAEGVVPPGVEMRWEVKVRGSNVTVLESAPMGLAKGEWRSRPMAQFRHGPEGWTLWWANSNDRWLRYDCPASADVRDLIAAVERNEWGCFD